MVSSSFEKRDCLLLFNGIPTKCSEISVVSQGKSEDDHVYGPERIHRTSFHLNSPKQMMNGNTSIIIFRPLLPTRIYFQ